MPTLDIRPLRKAARIALADFGVANARLTHLAGHHNDVFRVEAGGGRRFVLRIAGDGMTDPEASSQLKWLAALRANAGVDVPEPLATADGRPFTSVDTVTGRRRATLLRWVPGRAAQKHDDATFAAAAGMIAKLHEHAQTFRPPRGFTCRRHDADALFGPAFFVRHALATKHLTASQREIAALAERRVRDTMRRLGTSPRRFGVIHGDLNLNNIIFYRRRPSPIDFDEFGKGWYLFDLAELVRPSVGPDNWQARKQVVIDAYTKHRTLSALELAGFDNFLAATFVNYLNFVFLHARKRADLKWVGFAVDMVRRTLSA